MAGHDLILTVAGDDDESTDEAALDLLRDLGDGEVEVAPRRGTAPAPDGSKAGVADVLGMVTMTIGSGAVAPTVVMLHDWTKRRRKVCSLSVAIGTATLTFPDMTINEAMVVLNEHHVLPDGQSSLGAAGAPPPGPPG